jgi:hypothetical protein
MSHISTYEVQIKDVELFCYCARALGAEVQFSREANLSVKQFGSNVIENCAAEVKLPDWNFPIAVKANGEILYDHWGSPPDSMRNLGLALQRYNHNLIMKSVSMDMVLGQDPVEFITTNEHADGTQEIVIAL